MLLYQAYSIGEFSYNLPVVRFEDNDATGSIEIIHDQVLPLGPSLSPGLSSRVCLWNVNYALSGIMVLW